MCRFSIFSSQDGFAVELARKENEAVESLSIPFTRILKITTSPSYKESQCQEFGISMDLDEISSRKLAVLYGTALKDDRKKIIFYDLTWFDKPKMTITVLFKGKNEIYDCIKGLQRWVGWDTVYYPQALLRHIHSYNMFMCVF
ncbi:unnamed protein product [Angiostrongylus costaricensis]|uniref:PLAT domain-containing protein n=1 Tax=Angiostrongylus costaricensis TaxID=334426 RepID=A0A0R3PNG8_ANGCS|nr:unnamed protein product [Angiostrongylus costaricensis]